MRGDRESRRMSRREGPDTCSREFRDMESLSTYDARPNQTRRIRLYGNSSCVRCSRDRAGEATRTYGADNETH